ncbi:LOW QUALITY PROTEIN: N6-adenosine-methyltransferase catalytic subunit [Grus americana]|uniref:LOW QUALITY PROTEIN: N6-adenosine-methyltransferase catalytic subunit n=1 Tax=Grus americana TaxID=9117 RepID=UPI0024080C63|nr:LOW QUALITY PROTEIN: N6-adenosine-methyltransferase catalytic subunit [Grus americana]
MSDTWSSIQAHKKQLDSLRERLQRRRKQDPLDPRHADPSHAAPPPPPPTPTPGSLPPPGGGGASSLTPGTPGTPATSSTAAATTSSSSSSSPPPPSASDRALERRLLLHLADLALPLPTDALAICRAIATPDAPVARSGVESLLEKFAAQELIEVRRGLLQDDPSQPTLVTYADHSKLSAMIGAVTENGGIQLKNGAGKKRRAEQDGGGMAATAAATMAAVAGGGEAGKETAKKSRKQASDVDLEIESLLSQQSTKEQQSKKVSQEILELLNTTTAKEQSIVEKFRSRGRAQVQEFCDHGTKEECVKATGADRPCRKLHFRRIINKHTDESLGDCSFLNTCFHMDTCKYVHYEIDACPETPPRTPPQPRPRDRSPTQDLTRAAPSDAGADRLFPPQWICCDIRYLDVSILGKFAVVMADPPWDIHMELPYGTLTDDEMRRLNIPVLQDDGFLFLWVTGRAMELGRECLNLWGYERVDEIIWVKTNQLQRIIRTGRTGHWLNHGKEHCLVGVKGNPQGFNRGLDCDVIVAEVRSTSHKPDEIYGMIERLSPGTRKIELFGRPHNVQPNWITLGNQLDGIHLLDPDVVAQFKQHYPDGIISKPKNM